jgi:hypothetical protein
MKTCFGRFIVVALLAVAAGCVAPQPTPETRDVLLASDFKVVKAATPEQQAHLKTLPRGKITVVNRNGKTWYVFPDAARNQIFVGNLNQYRSFQQSYQDEQLTNARAYAPDESSTEAVWVVWGSWD